MKNTDENVELRTTDADLETAVTDEVETNELPKSWNDDERRQYEIVANYLKAVEDSSDAYFEGVPDKVVNRAKRDAK